VLVETPETVEIDEREQGPLRGTIGVRRSYEWPAAQPPVPERRAPEGTSEKAGGSSAASTYDVPIETTLELRAGEPFVRVRIWFDNPAEDQRVRVHLPLPRTADRTYAEGQYAVVERAPDAEGGYGEVPLPTYPASSFVAAGGLAVLLEHVTEYELLEGRELALTVLRSTGWISRNEHPYREEPAGPEIAIPAAQMRGAWTVSFALYPCAGDRPGPDVLEQAEHYRLPFLTLAGSGARGPLREREGPSVDGDGVVLAALRRRGASLEARVVNETPEPRRVLVAGIGLDLRPWEIRTLDLAYDTPASSADT
jgi:mannosylglycerate hydrolase